MEQVEKENKRKENIQQRFTLPGCFMTQMLFFGAKISSYFNFIILHLGL